MLVIEMYLRKALEVHAGETIVPDIVIVLLCAE